VPRFKVWIRIFDMPPKLWNATETHRVASLFGTILRTINLAHEGFLSSWNLVVAVTDLSHIPKNITINVGGMDIWMLIAVIKWVHCQMYTATDFPKLVVKFDCPSVVIKSYLSCSSTNDTNSDDDLDRVLMPCRALLEIIEDRDPTSLPEKIRSFLAGPKGLDTHSWRQRFINDAIHQSRHLPSIIPTSKATESESQQIAHQMKPANHVIMQVGEFFFCFLKRTRR
jgi:hypothetical protein